MGDERKRKEQKGESDVERKELEVMMEK